MSRRGALIVLVLADLAVVGSVLSWLAASREVAVAPVLEGEPSTVSTVYYAPLLTLSLLLATVAGVLAVVAISALRRLRRPMPDIEPDAANVHSP